MAPDCEFELETPIPPPGACWAIAADVASKQTDIANAKHARIDVPIRNRLHLGKNNIPALSASAKKQNS